MFSKVERWRNQVQLALDGLIEDMVNDGLSAVEIKIVIEKGLPYAVEDLEEIVMDYQEEQKNHLEGLTDYK